ncbi:pyridoxamine 5'-phosphate oxidase family protein [Spirochaeta cellobiosiphila]|uniref:pyridoxamine 5'-phosphate oxidase family protein n=1 Tax=Spirochaeta cellobiosiphila TaxID=504483 RepID=UPI0003FDA642|nr:pyridoxamine 5'-phosphate oxidase family protein [Spirochaeta cellobiosiphila]
MNVSEILDKLDFVIDDSNVGVLTTVDADGNPKARWMTPSLLRNREGFLYAVTSPKFKKATQIEANPKVHWLIQTKALDKVVSIKGTVNLIDNPSYKAEVLTEIGSRLGMFWKLNQNADEMVVLETVIEEAEYFEPLGGVRAKVDF